LALNCARSYLDDDERPAIRNECCLENAQRADQKKREAAAALRARQHEYQTANLRGRQHRIERARAALEAAQTTYEAAKRDVQRLYDKAEEVVQAQVRAAYM
jgi:vacuolar-type H+-ATPase subunit E/Vma4